MVLDRLGAQGDAIATLTDGKTVYVPQMLPGAEATVRLIAPRGDGFEAEVIDQHAGPEGAKPICAHFGACGGCAAQHLPDDLYQAWKRGLLIEALRRQGLAEDVPVAPLRRVPISSRRRVRFTALSAKGGVTLGFHGDRSDQVTDIADCPILHPDLAAWLPVFREIAPKLIAGRGRVQFQAAILTGGTLDGLDLVIHAAVEPDLAQREALAALAQKPGVLRVSWVSGTDDPEPIAAPGAAEIGFENMVVAVPPGGFLQPSKEGEDILRDLVVDGLRDAKTVLELFCGSGSFTGGIGKGALVTAVDSDAVAAAALARGAGRSKLGGRVKTEVRDLHRRPMLSSEMAGYDAVVLDPPRAGAKDQCLELAESAVPRVVMVSCHPTTFARDARALIDGGFRCLGVTPVDQFVYAHHLECVGVFER